ncbi:thioesterase family protein [Nocardia suismassiliense]|uniref:thioesterase family protein n=1 Tax=Nocardia suismassiliense TaxID=2077092 RepID=UPI000D1F46DD|nr:thioesterase family protein [Nocardia suismassiliense]
MQTLTEATAVTPSGINAFAADLSPQWAVGDKLHGGYLMTVMARAAEARSEHPHLTAISATFLAPPSPGAATVTVEVLRAGRTSTQLRARLEQNGRPCTEALITLGLLEDSAPWWTTSTTPAIPAEHECFHSPSNPPGAPFPVPLLDVVEHRLDPATLGFVVGEPSMQGRIATWLRLADGSDWDSFALPIALDPIPPASLTLGLPGWAPTISFTAYLRRHPAPGPLHVTMQATDVTSDRMHETAEIWDSKNNLVAFATQLAAVRTSAYRAR